MVDPDPRLSVVVRPEEGAMELYMQFQGRTRTLVDYVPARYFREGSAQVESSAQHTESGGFDLITMPRLERLSHGRVG